MDAGPDECPMDHGVRLNTTQLRLHRSTDILHFNHLGPVHYILTQSGYHRLAIAVTGSWTRSRSIDLLQIFYPNKLMFRTIRYIDYKI